MSSKQPRKKLEAKLFPFQARKNLFDMAKKYGKQKFTLIAVWTYMFTRSGKGNVFKLAESIILWDLGITHETLWMAQRILMAEGFLSKEKRGVKEVTKWTVLTGGLSANKKKEEMRQADNPPADKPTVDKSASGLSANTVGIHEQDADASTSKTSLPSEGTSTDGRLACSSVSDPPPSAAVIDEDQNEHLTSEQVLDQQNDLVRTLAEEILEDEALIQRLGIPSFIGEDVPDVVRMAKSLIFHSRTPSWLRDMVSWMKQHSFWKKRLHAGRRSVGQLAKFLATGEIAAQFDQHLAVDLGGDVLMEGRTTYVKVWYRDEAMSAASADAGNQAKGFDVEEAE